MINVLTRRSHALLFTPLYTFHNDIWISFVVRFKLCNIYFHFLCVTDCYNDWRTSILFIRFLSNTGVETEFGESALKYYTIHYDALKLWAKTSHIRGHKARRYTSKLIVLLYRSTKQSIEVIGWQYQTKIHSTHIVYQESYWLSKYPSLLHGLAYKRDMACNNWNHQSPNTRKSFKILCSNHERSQN